jgi:hypothetical protein
MHRLLANQLGSAASGYRRRGFPASAKVVRWRGRDRLQAGEYDIRRSARSVKKAAIAGPIAALQAAVAELEVRQV